MKNGRSLIDLAHELERQLPTKKDLLVPSSLMRYQTDERGNCIDAKLHERSPNRIRAAVAHYVPSRARLVASCAGVVSR